MLCGISEYMIIKVVVACNNCPTAFLAKDNCFGNEIGRSIIFQIRFYVPSQEISAQSAHSANSDNLENIEM